MPEGDELRAVQCEALAAAAYGPVSVDAKSGAPLYWCAYCGAASASPDDIANQYCGWCRRFAEALDPAEHNTPRVLMVRALARLLVENFEVFRCALRPIKLHLAPSELTADEAVDWYVEELKKQYS